MPPPNFASDTERGGPSPAIFLQPLPSLPTRPMTYSVHALRPIARRSFVGPFNCDITPSKAYVFEPNSQYAELGVPKHGVHLMPPPLSLCLDARGSTGDTRWVRNGCHPNAVLRPIVCGKKKQTVNGGISFVKPDVLPTNNINGKTSATTSDSDEEPDVTFGVFATRDLKAEEEIVLGWEWDDQHIVHELPRLLREGYGSGKYVSIYLF
ncbi:hypothetical protein M422DRAFT_173884 [Sphaerobolus stellatus SS14]|uniref:SET domain-containing protein n=1 Tax=Sphaerobolus stellatus (strain SS14) TaxID=990650 RepID=A0A0C9UAY5_SPHS4|nr:hypothetical protein M422DRAFT_173884 [Sphaerobolus stellatus SS14]